MANPIQPTWPNFPATPLTITLGGLASSTTGAGRQAAFIDNRTTRYRLIWLAVKITLGTNPVANQPITVYRLGYDGVLIYDDGAGAGDAAVTILNAEPIAVLNTGAAPATGTVLTKVFRVPNPGPWIAPAIVNGSGVALDPTNSNHSITWFGEYPQAQN